MTIEAKTTPIEEIALPYGRTATLRQLEYENGMRILQVTFRENRCFTVLDIDAERAGILGQALVDWARDNVENKSE